MRDAITAEAVKADLPKWSDGNSAGEGIARGARGRLKIDREDVYDPSDSTD